jgi:hypothetical protein
VVYVLSKCQPGDWFVLNQLGKNVNTYFFRAFMKELRAQVRDPKHGYSNISLMLVIVIGFDVQCELDCFVFSQM